MPDPTIQTPFLDVKSFFTGEVAPVQPGAPPALPTAPGSTSPFLSVYRSEGEGIDPRGEAYVQFLTELHDEEFDQALLEMVNEAAALYEEGLAPAGAAPGRDTGAERALEAHFQPLARELEQMVDALKYRYGQTPASAVSQPELETFLDEYRDTASIPPNFEYFFGSLFNKIKNIAGKAVSVVGNLALGPLFDKLKSLIKPLLKQVLQMGISHLSPPLQPLAQKVAERLGLLGELEAEANEAEPAADPSQIQHRFNRQVADLLFADNEAEQELEVSRAVTEAQAPPDNRLAQLDYARDQFVNGLARLKEGEEPTPLLENFLPALLPVLKLGLRLVGRSRVMNFLAGFLAKLIGNLVGPQNAPILSKAIVEAGFKLLNLEAGPQAEDNAAAEAVAATVEDTVRRVATLPEYIFEDQEMLEAATLEAFEQAATANLPPVLGEEIYRRRPDLREAYSLRGSWVPLPLLRRKRYKKFCTPGPIRVRITPQQAREMESFDGVPLSEFLEEQLGIPIGNELEAEVHLYESLPGTMLPELARMERHTPGLGVATHRAYGQLHPLTPHAAGILLGEPRLGRPLHHTHHHGRCAVHPGQRFYYLNVRGARPMIPANLQGGVGIRHPSGVRFTLDFPRSEVRVRLFLSEVRAQKLAVKLRERAHLGALVLPLRALVERDLSCVLRGGCHRRIKVIHGSVVPRQALGEALQRIPPALLNALAPRLQEWTVKGLAEFLKLQPQPVVAATESPADGITFVVTIQNPPGLEALREALKGRVVPGVAPVSGPEPTVAVRVAPGYVHG